MRTQSALHGLGREIRASRVKVERSRHSLTKNASCPDEQSAQSLGSQVSAVAVLRSEQHKVLGKAVGSPAGGAGIDADAIDGGGVGQEQSRPLRVRQVVGCAHWNSKRWIVSPSIRPFLGPCIERADGHRYPAGLESSACPRRPRFQRIGDSDSQSRLE